ncbi:hypothetical protein [Pseudopedobacter sp.]|uniref:hypothetical protein n=1 Tax=Pseudopedobacter sp. TaxID=1936787 RepID=UPI003341EDEA
MRNRLETVILEIHRKEEAMATQYPRLIDEAFNMTIYLQGLLNIIKKDIVMCHDAKILMLKND